MNGLWNNIYSIGKCSDNKTSVTFFTVRIDSIILYLRLMETKVMYKIILVIILFIIDVTNIY